MYGDVLEGDCGKEGEGEENDTHIIFNICSNVTGPKNTARGFSFCLLAPFCCHCSHGTSTRTMLQLRLLLHSTAIARHCAPYSFSSSLVIRFRGNVATAPHLLPPRSLSVAPVPSLLAHHQGGLLWTHAFWNMSPLPYTHVYVLSIVAVLVLPLLVQVCEPVCVRERVCVLD